MPISPRRMNQLKANFRQGQANYNRLVNIYKQINKYEANIKKLRNNQVGPLQTVQHFMARAQNAGNNRQRNLYMSKVRRLMKSIQQTERNIAGIRIVLLRPLKREAIRFYGTNQGLTPNQINQARIFTNLIRYQPQMRLAHALNKFLTRPGTPPKMSYIQRKNWENLKKLGITAPRANNA